MKTESAIDDLVNDFRWKERNFRTEQLWAINQEISELDHIHYLLFYLSLDKPIIRAVITKYVGLS